MSRDPAWWSGLDFGDTNQGDPRMSCLFPSEFPTEELWMQGSGFSRGQRPKVEELGTQEKACKEGTPFHVKVASPRASAQDAQAGDCPCNG